jgi:hypothetical protein
LSTSALLLSTNNHALLFLALQDEVLALVCTVVSDVRTMCAALCASSSARQAILAKCSGGLHLQLSPQLKDSGDITDTHRLAALRRMVQQSAWLAQYGGLVGQLQLQSHDNMRDADEAAWSLRPPLQLRCLQLLVHRPVPLLKQLEPSRLTSLEITLSDDHDGEDESPLLPAALSRLSGLQQLVIRGGWSCVHDSITAALAGMPQLTLLALQPQLPAAALAQLPSQLVELQLSNPECEAVQLVAHVQALQQLQSLSLLYEKNHTEPDIFRAHVAAFAAVPQLKQLELEL